MPVLGDVKVLPEHLLATRDRLGAAMAQLESRHAGVAQLVEHQLPKLRVVGSSPIARLKEGSLRRAVIGCGLTVGGRPHPLEKTF